MKKFICLALLFPGIATACTGYVLGFKGKNNSFDQQAFAEYASMLGYCAKSYSWTDTKSALKFISSSAEPYQLYGYSMGAVSVREILHKVSRKPEFVITIGAYKTADVNFDRFDVKYVNYFDSSGFGQISPGKFVFVAHNQIQQAVNKILLYQQDNKF